jgi:hypothetical protein
LHLEREDEADGVNSIWNNIKFIKIHWILVAEAYMLTCDSRIFRKRNWGKIYKVTFENYGTSSQSPLLKVKMITQALVLLASTMEGRSGLKTLKRMGEES